MTTDCDIFFKIEMTPAVLFFWSDFKPPYGNKVFPTKLNLINFLRFRCCISILPFWFGKFLKFIIPFTSVWKPDIKYCIQITSYTWKDNPAVLEKTNYIRVIIGIAETYRNFSIILENIIYLFIYQIWKLSVSIVAHLVYIYIYFPVELLSHLIN